MPDKAAITHAFEQYNALLRDFASSVAAYFKALRTQGFTRAEALTLTRDWQRDSVRRFTSPQSPEHPTG